jgi:sulfate adenylyltransferase subunit 2
VEAEAIHILREVAAEFENPVMLYSIGKDSSVMLRLAQKAFHPGQDPVPAAACRHHVQVSRDDRVPRAMARGDRVRPARVDQPGRKGPASIRSTTVQKYTTIMKTQALKQALNHYGFDAAFGGARRDEEKSRAKERVYSFRDKFHQWDPKNQRPELWNLYNSKVNKGESIRVFPLSNWTELDIWLYILRENIPDRAAVLRQGGKCRARRT